MGKYTKMFETHDYDPMQFGASVDYVLKNADKKMTGSEKKQFDDLLEMCNDGAHWVLEKNKGVGMPPGAPAKIMKIYAKHHSKPESDRDKLVDKVRGSRSKKSA